MSGKSHSLPIRVYYEDTDAGGIVFYANYLKFAERGRTEFLRAEGYEQKDLKDREGVLFVVRRIEAEYHKFAELDDVLTVVTEAADVRNSSFAMKQSIFRDTVLLFDMTVTLVCINLKGRPVRVPDHLKQAIAA
ncbi:MAG: tol-pal system-associated acyl-CoA thioesterase [Alphaproteobacteria bacterium]|nr:tol-pal system-associated acyl-CoA thioesterase [Alphaproteobacteria bacterium]